jgi:FAD synthetase
MTTVLAGGCFNQIHAGHIYFLKKAKSLGDKLVVVLANDRNNTKPYAIAAKERKKNLQALGIADEVLIGHSSDFSSTIKKIKPNIIALGYDQTLPCETKIKTVRIRKFGGYSSRKINA